MQNYMGGVLGGFQAGQQMRQQMDTRKAMGALLQNPNDPQAMQLLGRADPQAAMQFQQQQAQQRAAQLQQAREQLTTTFQLLSSATDEASYQRARQTAAQLGMDLSSIPPNFNPQWVQQSAQQARALLGKVDQELMAVAPGTAVIDKRTGQPVFRNPAPTRYYPVPPGGMLVPEPGGQPSGAIPPPPPGFVIDGGPSQNGSGGFPDPLAPL